MYELFMIFYVNDLIVPEVSHVLLQNILSD